MKIKIDLDNMINPHFDYVLYSNALNKVLKGGRGSTKSSVISLRIVIDFLQDSNANALILRKVANTLELSVYEQIKWAIYQLHVDSQFKFTKSPYRIMHKPTGTAFYFSGLDDPAKLKSMLVAKGYVQWLWFEELAEFDSWEEVDTVRASFTRKVLPPGKHVITYYSYNPPKNPYDWINKWIAERSGLDGWYIDHSTYQDVTLPNILSDDYLNEIETVKKNDLNYYKWMYLGEAIGLGNNVYNMNLFKRIKALFTDDPIKFLYYSADVGHQTSADAVGCFALTSKGKVILIDTYYYSPAGQTNKKPPSELSKDFYEFIKKSSIINGRTYQIRNRTIDSAEGGVRNQYFYDYGQRWHPVAKKKNVDMVDFVQILLAQGRFYYLDTENNKIFIDQHQRYRWDEKTLQSADPAVIKEDDHMPDMFKYFVIDNAKDLRWKQR